MSGTFSRKNLTSPTDAGSPSSHRCGQGRFRVLGPSETCGSPDHLRQAVGERTDGFERLNHSLAPIETNCPHPRSAPRTVKEGLSSPKGNYFLNKSATVSQCSSITVVGEN